MSPPIYLRIDWLCLSLSVRRTVLSLQHVRVIWIWLKLLCLFERKQFFLLLGLCPLVLPCPRPGWERFSLQMADCPVESIALAAQYWKSLQNSCWTHKYYISSNGSLMGDRGLYVICAEPRALLNVSRVKPLCSGCPGLLSCCFVSGMLNIFWYWLQIVNGLFALAQ